MVPTWPGSVTSVGVGFGVVMPLLVAFPELPVEVEAEGVELVRSPSPRGCGE